MSKSFKLIYQRQSSGGTPCKAYFQKPCKYYREIPVLESAFNKVAGCRPSTSSKRDFSTGPSKFLEIFEITFFQNITGRQLWINEDTNYQRFMKTHHNNKNRKDNIMANETANMQI